MEKIKFAKVREVKTPERGTEKSAGIDFFIPAAFEPIVLSPGDDIVIPSGIKAKVPEGYMLIAENKSGVAASEQGVRLSGRQPKKDALRSPLLVGACVIDEDYQGEINIHIINVGHENVVLQRDMKIVQFILVPVSYAVPEIVDEKELFSEATSRGEGGFGSTN